MKNLILLLAVALCFAACSISRTVNLNTDDGKIAVNFLQVNDVYEISPLQGGKVGGVARVAALKKELLAENPNTYMLMAGDFLSPSVYNSLRHDGKRVRGAQMVDALNTAGLDFAVFGNHEFDINETELQSRLNESEFQWISSNTFHQTKDGVQPFRKFKTGGEEIIPENFVLKLTDKDGTTARIGFLGVTLPFNKVSYVAYTNPMETAVQWYERMKDSCDAIIAITHLALEEDSLLALRLPGLTAIVGGHEHDMRYITVGNVPITKAHANAISAFILKVTIDKTSGKVQVVPELKMIDASLNFDPQTQEVVDKWNKIAVDNFGTLGFDAMKVVRSKGEPLDGRESVIRAKPSNLTRILVSAMEKAAPEADVAIFNSGSIRVDDILQMPVTQYDIIRRLPYGGTIVEVDMQGSLLQQVLETGRTNVGSGGFLQYSSAVRHHPEKNSWTIQELPIDTAKIYRVAISDFLLTGGEARMDYLTEKNPGIMRIYPKSNRDIRIDLISYMEGLEGLMKD